MPNYKPAAACQNQLATAPSSSRTVGCPLGAPLSFPLVCQGTTNRLCPFPLSGSWLLPPKRARQLPLGLARDTAPTPPHTHTLLIRFLSLHSLPWRRPKRPPLMVPCAKHSSPHPFPPSTLKTSPLNPTSAPLAACAHPCLLKRPFIRSALQLLHCLAPLKPQLVPGDLV